MQILQEMKWKVMGGNKTMIVLLSFLGQLDSCLLLVHFPNCCSCPFVDETVSNSTDGEIPILRPVEERHEKSKKTVTFSPGWNLN